MASRDKTSPGDVQSEGGDYRSIVAIEDVIDKAIHDAC